MNQDLETALKLQSLDMRAAELRREIALLPRHVAEIEKALVSHLKQLELDKTALTANQRDRKKQDSDIQVQQQKISKLKDQTLSAKTNEQYRAFQHEIEFCEGEVRKCEDRILELMVESELLEKNVKIAEKALAQEKAVVEGEKKVAQTRTAADEAELKKTVAERTKFAAKLPKPMLELYERLRLKLKNGVALSESAGGLCVECQMRVRPQLFQELKLGEVVVQCENCKRILYYQPVLAVEPEMNV
jgi:predicted  nucleic acid-binding Zn-ribbon protein